MRWTVVAAALLLAACVASLPPPRSAACALVRSPGDPRIAGWSVDKFTGVYWSVEDAVPKAAAPSRESLIVRRDGNRLLAEARRFGIRDLRMVSEGVFEDGCGARFEFFLPADGPGARLHTRGSRYEEGFLVWERIR